MSRYVGVTGFVSRDEVDFALSFLPEGLTLMCGVLVSAKTLRGERNKWWRRYANPETMADIFSPDPRCLNLIHYCAGSAPDERTLDHVSRLAGPDFHGFQFNGRWPTPEVLASYGGIDVVLQLRPDGATGTMDRLRAAVGAMPECRSHVLLDVSGGRGLLLDPDVCDAWAMMIRGAFGNDVGLGFAGGLDADNLPRIGHEVRTWDASIDAEGRLRDGDEGGVLNREKVRAYLRVAGEVMQAPTAPEKG